MLLLVNNLHEKTLQKGKTDEILEECALFVILTRVTTLHLCYMRMHWFSARIFFIFSVILVFFICIRIIFMLNK